MQSNTKSIFSKSTLALAIATLSLTAGGNAVAQDDDSGSTLEEIITVGTRSQGRTAIESAVPVDFFSAEEMETVGYNDTLEALRVLSPSLRVSRNIMADGTKYIRPPSIRGLPASFGLVTVNGKRRHKSALISGGNQFSDMAVVPPFAIKSIEILRDGSSAQYGSDAISGVYNFNLKDDASGGKFRVTYGQTADGEGENTVVDGNIGLPLTDSGFVNATFSYNNQSQTSNANNDRRDDLVAKGFNPPNPIVVWGRPKEEDFYGFINAGLDLGNGMEAYAFGNYTYKDGISDFGPRLPGHSTGSQYGPFAAHSVYGCGNGGGCGKDVDDDPETYSKLDQSAAHPGMYNLYNKFPDGFTPQFGAKIDDFSATAGLKGELDYAGGITYDLSYRWGENRVVYRLGPTVNPSLGNASPTQFNPGSLENREWELAGDFGTEIDLGLENPVQVFFGATHKNERYTIGGGDEASWKAGPLTDLSIGSNGFAGFPPEGTGSWTDRSTSGYIDIELDVNDRLYVGASGRYDYYTAFGGTSNYKFKGRFEITDEIAIRGSVGTGFFAPTSGLKNRFSITNAWDDAIGSTVEGNFPSSHVVAQYFGAQALTTSSADTYSLGFTYENDIGTTLEVTMYKIDVEDRLTTSADHTVTAAERVALKALGFANANALTNVSFLQNTEASEDEGLDLVASQALEWDSIGQSTDITLALNFNRTYLIDGPTEAAQAASDNVRKDVVSFEEGKPPITGNLSIQHHIPDLGLDVGLRANYYKRHPHGGRDNLQSASSNQYRSSAVLWDLNANYMIDDNWSMQAQVLNIFDKMPKKEQNFFGYYMGQELQNSDYGVEGTKWRISISYEFD